MKSGLFDFDLDVPMDLAVAHWRMIHDDDFRDRWQKFGAECEKWRMQAARDLLTACETLDYAEVYEYVKTSPPSADVITGLVQLTKDAQKSKSAQSAAIQRHAENRSMKADVFTWLDANMVNFKSMDKAAEEIAKNVSPIAFRTARDWTGEWKKLRSTGTP